MPPPRALPHPVAIYCANSQLRTLVRRGRLTRAAGPQEIDLVACTRHDGVPYGRSGVGFLALFAALDVVAAVVDDEERAGAVLRAVVLNLLDDAQIFAVGAGLRLRVFLPQPHGYLAARPLHLMGGAVGRP